MVQRRSRFVRSVVGDDQFTPEPSQSVLKNLRSKSSGAILDRALVTYFPAPNSFTGEDMVEISCHGSPVILRQVAGSLLLQLRTLDSPVRASSRCARCRNGKMNLSQAEAIRDLINAQTEAAAQQRASVERRTI